MIRGARVHPVFRRAAEASAAVSAIACAACSSGGAKGAPDASLDGSAHHDGGSRDAGTRSHDASADVIVDPKNCVPPGTQNNAAGVGGYCSPGGGQCMDAGTICTADFGSMVPAHAWFCTDVCNAEAGTVACGSPGPACLATPAGLAVCLPEMCLGFLGDGGAFGDAGANDTTETVVVDGTKRTFIVHVPPSVTGAMPVPLVFDFHPLEVSASTWKSVSNWAPTADANGFIVVWPQGIGDEWNAGRCCGKADDVAFTRAMIAQISGERSIDAKRIYATGCSNGGGMSYRLACDAADVIAAVAPVNFDCITGSTNDPSCGSCRPSRPVSETQFMGTADMYVPYDGGPTSVIKGLDFPSAKANFATWATIDGCSGKPATEPSLPSCQTYDACSAEAGVTLCTIKNGTHCGSYGTYPIVDTAWKAFQSQSLP
jgi:polyhydroxybutyrate depolymerase